MNAWNDTGSIVAVVLSDDSLFPEEILIRIESRILLPH